MALRGFPGESGTRGEGRVLRSFGIKRGETGDLRHDVGIVFDAAVLHEQRGRNHRADNMAKVAVFANSGG